MGISDDNIPLTFHHDSIALQIEHDITQYHIFWIEIKNRSSKAISVSNQICQNRIFAKSVNHRWPLHVVGGTPCSIEIGSPIDGESGRFTLNTVDVNPSKTIMIKPGGVLICKFDLRKMLKNDNWSWMAHPTPPKSPIMDMDGKRSQEPIALWAEFPQGTDKTPLRTRPLMVSIKRLFDPTDKKIGTGQ